MPGIDRNEHLGKQIRAVRQRVHGRVIEEITSETERHVTCVFADSFEQTTEHLTRPSLQRGRQRGGCAASRPRFGTARQPSTDRGLPPWLCLE